MATGQAPLPIQTFVNPDGTPVANGYITVRLNVNAQVNVSGVFTQVQSNSIKMLLDSSGTIIGGGNVWETSLMSPKTEDLYYVVNVYTQAGQLIGTYKVTVS
jgi:hypothetical protein